MKSRGRWWLAVTAAILTAPLLTGIPASAGTGSTVTGTITDSSGAPAANQTVDLYALPTNDAVAAENVGDTMAWNLVTTTTTDSSGQFSATLTPAEVQPYANPDGNTNLDAVVAGGEGFYGFTVTAAAPSYSGADMSMDVVNGTAPLCCCHAPVLIHVYDPHWFTVGETSIRISGDEKQQFTYQQGQSSSLGVAVSNPANGSWTGSGSYSQSSTNTIPFKQFGSKVSHKYSTEWEYGAWTTGCRTYAQAYKYIGGGENPTQNAPPASHCVSYPAGSAPSFNKSKAVTFSAAINIPDLGIGLSGQTGWDTNGQIQYWMGSNSHFICGGSDYPGGDPKVLDVGQ